jgi:hypothetical protein
MELPAFLTAVGRLAAPLGLVLAACSTGQPMSTDDRESPADLTDPTEAVAEATFAAG